MRTSHLIILIVLAVIAASFIGTLAYFTYHPPEPSSGASTTPLTPLTVPVVTSTDPLRGNPAAPITIVEFGDFLCPPCADAEKTLMPLLAQYSDKIKLVWKDAPQPVHPLARAAARAARCAQEQGHFWEYHDILLRDQAVVTSEDNFKTIAQNLELDMNVFADCLAAQTVDTRIEHSFNEAILLNIDATPYFFIGDKRFSGIPTEQGLIQAIETTK